MTPQLLGRLQRDAPSLPAAQRQAAPPRRPPSHYEGPGLGHAFALSLPEAGPRWANLSHAMGSLIKKRRKRMRKKKHKKMLKRTRWQRRAAGK